MDRFAGIDRRIVLILNALTNKPKIYKRRPSGIPAVLSISMVLFLIGLLVMMLYQVKIQTDAYKESFEFQVYFVPEATEKQALGLKFNLEKMEVVGETEFFHKDEETEKFMKYLKEDFVNVLETSPIPHSLDVTLRADNATEKEVDELIQSIEDNPLVNEVGFKKDLLKQINRNIKLITLVLLGVTVIFLLIAVVMINSTVRLSLFSKRFIIKSMQFVGATESFIMRPILRKFSGYGVIAALIATALVYGVSHMINDQFGTEVKKVSLIQFGGLFIILVILGVSIVWFSTFFATRKYLRLKIDQLY